ncbi:hypothetical protein U1Q18_032086, partial [Sarracenia purpurea var. burkii]
MEAICERLTRLERFVGTVESDNIVPLVEHLDYVGNAIQSLKAAHEFHVVQINTKFME